MIVQKGVLTNRILLEIQEALKINNASSHKLPGTALENITTGETVYTPTQDLLDNRDLNLPTAGRCSDACPPVSVRTGLPDFPQAGVEILNKGPVKSLQACLCR